MEDKVKINNLESLYPELAKEWDYEKNGSLTPQMVTKGSAKKVWWLCNKGHSYEASICSRTSAKSSCPYCSGRKLLVDYNDLATTNPELVKEWDYKKNGDLTPQMVTKGMAKKVWWLCEEGHSYEAKLVHRATLGTNCPYCSGKRVLEGYNDFATIYPELAKEWDYKKNENLTPQMVTKGANKKVWWLCEEGHSYEATLCHRAIIGTNCPYCSGKRVLEGYNDFATTNPELSKEWNYKKNGNLTPQMVTRGMNKKVWWLCKKGHSYETTLNHRINGSNCPICSGKKILKGYNDLVTTNPELVKEWDYKKNGDLTPQMVTRGMNKKVWWLCKCGHSYEARIYNRILGKGCPYCSGSKTERLVYEILRKNKIKFMTEKKFNYHTVMYYPYDIYIPSLRLIIEPDGMQHFQKTSGSFEHIPFELRVKHDNIKNEYCTDNGYYGNARIPILRIPYIFSPNTEKDKIEKLVLDFIETRQVPKEILDFYKPYKESIGSNYYDIATKMNEIEKVS